MILATIVTASLLASALGEGPAAPPGTPPAEENLEGEAWLSADGAWCAYRYSGPAGAGLRLVELDTGRDRLIPGGERLAFSPDSRWATYALPGGKAALLRLGDGRERPFEPAPAAMQFLAGGRWLAVQQPGPGPGATRLRLLDLVGGSEEVAEARAVAVRRDGALAAWVVADGGGWAVEALDARTGRRARVYGGDRELSQPTWHFREDRLGLLEAAPGAGPDPAGPSSVTVLDPFSGRPRVHRIDPRRRAGFPAGRRLAGPWTGDDRTPGLAMLRDPAAAPKAPGRRDGLVEVWRGDDPELYPFAGADLDRYRAGFPPGAEFYRYAPGDGSWRRLGDGTEIGFTPLGPGGDRYVGVAVSRGAGLVQRWSIRLWDVARAGPLTIAERSPAQPLFDPRRGGAILYFEGGRWREFDPDAGRGRDPAGSPDVPWTSDPTTDPGHTDPEQPARIDAYPLSDGSFLVGDRYDVHRWRPGVGLRRLTDGAARRVVYQPIPGGDADEGDAGRPVYFTSFDEGTKRAGFEVLGPGDARPRPLYRADARLFAPRRFLMDRPPPLLAARDGGRYLFRSETADEPPALFAADADFRHVRRVSRQGPAPRADGRGRSELVAYSADGRPLAGILTAPAAREAGRAYPMVVLVYGAQSDDLHEYAPPRPADPLDARAWSGLGYYVLRPDVTLRPGDPAATVVRSVEAAVAAARARAPIDPGKVGILGASFGGYEALLAVAKSDAFAAAAAINPVTDLISSYGGLQPAYRASGPDSIERGHFRLGVPPWSDPGLYARNSPVLLAASVARPVLLAHGEKDEVVDWRQSLEMYIALRRLGRPVTLLKYPGEGHGIAGPEAGPDLARRVRHFFDVHLRGARPEDWLAPLGPAADAGPAATDGAGR